MSARPAVGVDQSQVSDGAASCELHALLVLVHDVAEEAGRETQLVDPSQSMLAHRLTNRLAANLHQRQRLCCKITALFHLRNTSFHLFTPLFKSYCLHQV